MSQEEADLREGSREGACSNVSTRTAGLTGFRAGIKVGIRDAGKMKKDSASRNASATFASLFVQEEDGLPGHRGFGGPGSPSHWHCVQECGSSEHEEVCGCWVAAPPQPPHCWMMGCA